MNRMTLPRSFAVATLALAATFAVHAQEATPATGGASSTMGTKARMSADQKFVTMAATGGMAEVELGKLAQQQASDPQVKSFAAKMVEDHSKANDQLKQLASSKNMQLPTTLDKAHQKMADKMRTMQGAEFDKAYMKAMLADHKKDVAAYTKASKSAKDPDVKAFAAQTLPTLQGHLSMVQSMQGATKNAAASGGMGKGKGSDMTNPTDAHAGNMGAANATGAVGGNNSAGGTAPTPR